MTKKIQGAKKVGRMRSRLWWAISQGDDFAKGKNGPLLYVTKREANQDTLFPEERVVKVRIEVVP